LQGIIDYTFDIGRAMNTRKYTSIWESIKKSNYSNEPVTLLVCEASHKKVIQAIRKEKTRDTAWFLSSLEKGFKYELKSVSLGNRIFLTLILARDSILNL